MIPTSAQPIETVYKNCRFRSRLEARWAVVFDALGLQWDYEPEGFELSCGRYLPDFYIRDWGVYVEIKPTIGHMDDDKLETFSREQCAIVCLIGTPGDEYLCLLFCHVSTTEKSEPESWRMFVEIGEETGSGQVLLWAYSHWNKPNGVYLSVGSPDSRPLTSIRFRPDVDPLTERIAAGRLARFEFGQSGVN